MAPDDKEFGSVPEHDANPQDGWVTGNRRTETAPGAAPPAEVSARSVADHLSALLQSADGAARRIVEEAEAKARDQMAEVDRRSRRVEAEAARLASWSRQTEKLIQAMWSAFSEFRRDVEAVPQRINEVLGPLVSHASVVARQIDNLTSALGSQAPDRPAAQTPLSPEGTTFSGPLPFEVEAGDGSVQPGQVSSWDDFASGTP